MTDAPEIFAVIGPNGSGKSSAIFETNVDQSIAFINPDDIARAKYADVVNEDERNYLAWANCNAQRDALLTEGITFGFETVGSHPSKVEFLKKAKSLGYKITILFVSTEDPSINIERIRQRQAKGGHGVLDEKVRSRYYRTLELLPQYFDVADSIFIWDNSLEAGNGTSSAIRELVRKTGEELVILPAAENVAWVQRHLLDCLGR